MIKQRMRAPTRPRSAGGLTGYPAFASTASNEAANGPCGCPRQAHTADQPLVVNRGTA